ncbi:hypothetical protein BO70DRAFT_366942 [Aspergillus heteromorphus CBS 117.55]|uniref:Uncharacterized protein n=1 Tax=Aspergillus heteromorphus CBS 117.55 TaxID=1448321 RepID=A0A317UUG3_9EURO|nr:uncharacterized protein BO70DRAFT_366942 [Aspergillus heteromorphus CBS 117.55]PWY64718.1 hypothetical protein BO70DRAFT_366942 [Aspergillus heteromorphus CBS 117.55]
MAQHTCLEVNRGKKRPAENEPEGDQPLAKRFGQLHINSITSSNMLSNHDSLPASEMMLLDDTKHTVYIHDLAKELANSEPTDYSVEILPGIMDDIVTIPQLLVTRPEPQCKDLVLYTEPSSLLVPRVEGGMQKAVMATREYDGESQYTRCSSLQSRHSYPAVIGDKDTSDMIQGLNNGGGDVMEVDVNC